jgi:hypothetical protein
LAVGSGQRAQPGTRGEVRGWHASLQAIRFHRRDSDPSTRLSLAMPRLLWASGARATAAYAQLMGFRAAREAFFCTSWQQLLLQAPHLQLKRLAAHRHPRAPRSCYCGQHPCTWGMGYLNLGRLLLQLHIQRLGICAATLAGAVAGSLVGVARQLLGQRPNQTPTPTPPQHG